MHSVLKYKILHFFHGSKIVKVKYTWVLAEKKKKYTTLKNTSTILPHQGVVLSYAQLLLDQTFL